MIIVMKKGASASEIQDITRKVGDLGFKDHVISGETKTVIGCVGSGDKARIKALVTAAGVESVFPVSKPYKLAARSSKQEDTVVDVNGVQIGGGACVVFAGPCSVETEDQINESARIVKNCGAHFLRGGAYKPRTSPYSFQGLEEEGLSLLAAAREKTGLPIITELLSPRHLPLVDQYADIIQIGARNMQNFSLLKECGKSNKPIFLKRGLSSTIEELLMSAEYIMSEGNYNVILCERGIRTFETAYRNTLDLNAVPALKQLTHLPVVVDPSHGTGRIDLVIPMAKAAIAAGADGIMCEMHPNPEVAFSDGPQSLNPDHFKQFMAEIQPFVKTSGKVFPS
ncbi:3-deoxy-7-phosphoheptulonate synthase [Candidatus Marinamargulisbacteria bacterium SCGC AG-343-D04]|nr:3-deoxy-7-phosphoheptulonate synthase [Candidatus Marinamargulisbacteria bacterium SCGC AG-343-D04]